MISIKTLLFGLTASLPLAIEINAFAQQRGDYGGWGMVPGMMGGMGNGMVRYDFHARLLDLADSGSCLSHQMADSDNQQWKNGWRHRSKGY